MPTKPTLTRDFATASTYPAGHDVQGEQVRRDTPTPELGFQPGQPVLPEHINGELGLAWDWLRDWVFLGTSSADADAHIVETDGSGRISAVAATIPSFSGSVVFDDDVQFDTISTFTAGLEVTAGTSTFDGNVVATADATLPNVTGSTNFEDTADFDDGLTVSGGSVGVAQGSSVRVEERSSNVARAAEFVVPMVLQEDFGQSLRHFLISGEISNAPTGFTEIVSFEQIPGAGVGITAVWGTMCLWGATPATHPRVFEFSYWFNTVQVLPNNPLDLVITEITPSSTNAFDFGVEAFNSSLQVENNEGSASDFRYSVSLYVSQNLQDN